MRKDSYATKEHRNHTNFQSTAIQIFQSLWPAAREFAPSCPSHPLLQPVGMSMTSGASDTGSPLQGTSGTAQDDVSDQGTRPPPPSTSPPRATSAYRAKLAGQARRRAKCHARRDSETGCRVSPLPCVWPA